MSVKKRSLTFLEGYILHIPTIFIVVLNCRLYCCGSVPGTRMELQDEGLVPGANDTSCDPGQEQTDWWGWQWLLWQQASGVGWAAPFTAVWGSFQEVQYGGEAAGSYLHFFWFLQSIWLCSSLCVCVGVVVIGLVVVMFCTSLYLRSLPGFF